MAWGSRADIPTHLHRGRRALPLARPPAEVMEIINGAKNLCLRQEHHGVQLGAPGYERAPRVGLKMSENGGSETPRPHILPAALVQTSHAGPQTLCPTPTPHHHGHHLWKGSPECRQRKGHVVLLKAPSANSRPQAVPGGSTELVPARPHPAGTEGCALLQTWEY